ncbi:MAG: hypothetical protein R3194_14225, partial [Limnobacter sp.]|nr:hypothetical protein [Limnobacter sp.]
MVRKTASLGQELKVTSQNEIAQSGGLDDGDPPLQWVDVLIAAPLSDVFTYQWNSELTPQFGMRVIVSFGRRKVVGVVYGLSPLQDKPAFKVKQVEAVLDDGLLLSPAWFELLKFCASYYHYPLGLITLEALP